MPLEGMPCDRAGLNGGIGEEGEVIDEASVSRTCAAVAGERAKFDVSVETALAEKGR